MRNFWRVKEDGGACSLRQKFQDFLVACGSSFGPEIFGFCRSGPGGSPGIFRF